MSQSETKNQYYEQKLPSRESFSSYDTGNGRKFTQLSLVNLFIGSNNSGKSRFLRELFIEKEYEYITKSFNGNVYLDYLKKIHPGFIEIFKSGVTQVGETPKTIFNEFLKMSLDYISPATNELYAKILYALETTHKQSGNFHTVRSVNRDQKEAIIENLRKFGDKAIEEFKKLKNKSGDTITI